jgi:GxxExxY protein
MKYREITGKVIECALKVHRKLGFGFLENVYANALMIELKTAGLGAEKEKRIEISYEDELIGDYVADIIVDNKIILELKAVKEVNSAHEAQLINYLKATGMEVGLLINFGEKIQIKRKVL